MEAIQSSEDQQRERVRERDGRGSVCLTSVWLLICWVFFRRPISVVMDAFQYIKKKTKQNDFTVEFFCFVLREDYSGHLGGSVS